MIFASGADITWKNEGRPIGPESCRNRALQHLVTTAPPPVVAALLGYHPGTVFKHHEQAAGNYSRYASAAAAKQDCIHLRMSVRGNDH